MKFVNIIVCDKVHIHNTGKHIIIGAYSDNISVPAFPVELNLSIWSQFYADRNGDMNVEVRVLANKKEVTRGEGNFQINDYKALVTSVFKDIPLQPQGEGMLTFQIREKNGRWKTFKKISIRKST